MDALIAALVNRRVHLGMNQADVADKLNCTQSWVAKMENRGSVDWTLRQVDAYAKAVSMEFTFELRTTDPEPRTEKATQKQPSRGGRGF